jgi:hypothetical protein
LETFKWCKHIIRLQMASARKWGGMELSQRETEGLIRHHPGNKMTVAWSVEEAFQIGCPRGQWEEAEGRHFVRGAEDLALPLSSWSTCRA